MSSLLKNNAYNITRTIYGFCGSTDIASTSTAGAFKI